MPPRQAASRSACLGIMLSEQTLLNAAVLTVDATARPRAGRDRVQRAADRARAAAALPGDPDLAAAAPHRPGGDRRARGVRARDPHDRARDRRVRRRRARSGCCVVGPFAMRHVFFGAGLRLRPLGLALVGVGMGLHLTSGALNQAALARDGARAAAGCWLLAAAAVRRLDARCRRSPNQLLRAEVGYAGAAGSSRSPAAVRARPAARLADARLSRRARTALGRAERSRGRPRPGRRRRRRRAGDEHVRARPAARRARSPASMPPSTSSAGAGRRQRAQARELVQRVRR